MKVKKWIGEGLKPNSVNCNVLNVLRTLIENKNTVVYIPDGYKNGSTSTGSDPRVHFFPSEAGKRIEVVGITSNQKRFNFSLLGLANVLVEEPCSDSEEIKLVPKKVWRQYNVIRDSKLMFDYIIAKLDEESFNDLRNAGLLYYNGMKVPMNHCHNPEFLYKVMLNNIPLISLNWAQPVNIGLYEMMKEDISISQNLKAIKSKIKKRESYPDFVPIAKEDNSLDIYTEKYSKPVTCIKSGESYEADCIVYRFPDLEKEDFTEDKYDKYTYEALVEFKSYLTSRQKDIRFMIRCIIMAIENSKKKGSYEWSEEYLVPRSKSRYRKETTIEVDSSPVKLVRERFTETVNL